MKKLVISPLISYLIISYAIVAVAIGCYALGWEKASVVVAGGLVIWCFGSMFGIFSRDLSMTGSTYQKEEPKFGQNTTTTSMAIKPRETYEERFQKQNSAKTKNRKFTR